MPNRAILVVEDHHLSASLIIELLRGAFPARAVHVAATATHGFSEFARLQPSLVVMDIGLPDASGLEVTRRIVAANPGTPVVVYSGNDGAVMRDAAAAVGARAFVSKSDPRELLRVVAQLLDGLPGVDCLQGPR
ncbi:MAG: two component transcriptional regulator, LuxR family [Ramlibacter sp.]|nr:two component transcriptional regulator, LuxR family [Ramlibacter sp.]